MVAVFQRSLVLVGGVVYGLKKLVQNFIGKRKRIKNSVFCCISQGCSQSFSSLPNIILKRTFQKVLGFA